MYSSLNFKNNGELSTPCIHVGGQELTHIKIYQNGSNQNTGCHLSKVGYVGVNGKYHTLFDAPKYDVDSLISHKEYNVPQSVNAYVDFTSPAVLTFEKPTFVSKVLVRGYFPDNRYYYGVKVIGYNSVTNTEVEIYDSKNTGSYGNNKTLNTYVEVAEGRWFDVPSKNVFYSSEDGIFTSNLEFSQTSGKTVLLLDGSDFGDKSHRLLTVGRTPTNNVTIGDGGVFGKRYNIVTANAIQTTFQIFESNTYTIEGWFYFVTASNVRYIWQVYSNDSNRWNFEVNGTTGKLHGLVNGSDSIVACATPVPISQWCHLAVVVTDGVGVPYINGIKQAVTYDCPKYNNLFIGSYPNAIDTYRMNGYIGAFRVSRVARYSGDFHPNRGPFLID